MEVFERTLDRLVLGFAVEVADLRTMYYQLLDVPAQAASHQSSRSKHARPPLLDPISARNLVTAVFPMAGRTYSLLEFAVRAGMHIDQIDDPGREFLLFRMSEFMPALLRTDVSHEVVPGITISDLVCEAANRLLTLRIKMGAETYRDRMQVEHLIATALGDHKESASARHVGRTTKNTPSL